LVPSVWPDTIESLNLDYNCIHSINHVTHWSESLRELSLDDNSLDSLPHRFPRSLETISIINCNLKKLYALPSTLKNLRATYNFINAVGLLPYELQYVHFAHNMLRSSAIFRHRLPPNLKVLQLDYNYITWLPSTFPDTLETLNVSNNNLTEFKCMIPPRLKLLILNNNRIREFQPSWPSPMQQVITVYIQNNCITSNLVKLDRPNRGITIYQEDNWNKVIHGFYVKMIQYAFVRYTLKKGIRSWARIAKLREELLAMAMHPDRVGQFEDVPSWGIKS
jgi:Leucine-rich repeat (LRR) protein